MQTSRPAFLRRVVYGPVLSCLLLLAGCHSTPPAKPESHAATSSAPAEKENGPLPLTLDQAALTRSLLDSLQKRVMGRRQAIRDIERVVNDLGPLVAEAARQPEVEPGLQVLAATEGVSPEEMRERWMRYQEADLLLEAGGDPDAVSSAQAVGVAQWLAGTGKRCGLTVDSGESLRLTEKIDERKWRIAWAEYVLRPDADAKAFGNPGYDRARAGQELPPLRAELEALRAKRRTVDARYAPRPAIFAQTRYLLGIAPKFPSADWLFQAYHGGEGGVTRLLKEFLGAAWPGSASIAIRTGRNGQPLRFEDFYFATNPKERPEAFAYLYGRGDDHRHYWWKLRAAQEAIALYRKDKAAFHTIWERLSPGRIKTALWYPEAANHVFKNADALKAARKSGGLLPVEANSDLTIYPAVPNLPDAPLYNALRPEARGALLLLIAAYRQVGGTALLETDALTETPALAAKYTALQKRKPRRSVKPVRLYPPDPDAKKLPGTGPPPDFDFHTAGLAFNLRVPADSQQHKLLAYALGYLEDRQILWHYEEKEFLPAFYVVFPNPRYTDALTGITSADVTFRKGRASKG